MWKRQEIQTLLRNFLSSILQELLRSLDNRSRLLCARFPHGRIGSRTGEAGDQRFLTQDDSVVGFCCGYRLHWLASCDGFTVSGPLVELGGNCAVPHQEQNR